VDVCAEALDALVGIPAVPGRSQEDGNLLRLDEPFEQRRRRDRVEEDEA
jgi:hypothetical protein